MLIAEEVYIKYMTEQDKCNQQRINKKENGYNIYNRFMHGFGTLIDNDKHWMAQALQLAEQAAHQNEVPVGALIVDDKGVVLSKAWNQPIATHDPCAHAEIIALREAGQIRKNYRLVPDITLYVTLEPCAMCVGAMIHARIARLVFGAFDPKSGAVTSALPLLEASHFNHRIAWTGGVLDDACATLLKTFFSHKR